MHTYTLCVHPKTLLKIVAPDLNILYNHNISQHITLHRPIQPLFQIDLVLTCEELLESWPVRKLFGCLHIHHWYAIQESRELYSNAPETLLPQWCKGDGDYTLVNYPENEKSDGA